MVFAIACGLVAANIYYAQPMLETIARQFHATSAAIGQIVTLTQLGFAVDLLPLVPLDNLIAVTLLVATVALVGPTLAPSLAVLLVASLLARPPYNYSQAVIGLFELVGVAGALAASAAGHWADHGQARRTTGGFITATLLSWGLIALGGASVVALIIGILLLDLGTQGIHITTQSEIYRLRPEARSRLAAVYMTTYFLGGALGHLRHDLRRRWPCCSWLTELGRDHQQPAAAP